jgi:ABC-type amino acid transport substrate-binding protein
MPELINATKAGTVDASIAAISLTPEREKVVDFSHSYFSTSLGILSKTKLSMFENFLWAVQRISVIFAIFIGGLYVIGFVMYRQECNAPHGQIKTINQGVWWALVTFTTTGYGDMVPTTKWGMRIASIWMVTSLFLLSIFTGYVASALTIKKLSETTITLADLYDVKVEVVKGTTAELKLAELGIEYDTVPTLPEALKNFRSGKSDAVVYDKAILDYQTRDDDEVSVWPIENSDEYYGIALPQDSEYTEKVNLGILKVLSSPEWKASKINYFGVE